MIRRKARRVKPDPADILIVGYVHEAHGYPEFALRRVFSVSELNQGLLSGRTYRIAYLTDMATRRLMSAEDEYAENAYQALVLAGFKRQDSRIVNVRELWRQPEPSALERFIQTITRKGIHA